MRYTRALIPTQKEAPVDASAVSHVLLHRGGYVRRVGAGIYSFLPLGLRVLHRIEQLVRREMNAAGAQEVLLPILLPADTFRETGRWDTFGDNLFRLKDRKGGDYHLGPTHEEIITDMVRREVRSYRDLPRNLYQIQSKFRDEPRPRGGLLRGREFLMKDAYSFDLDEEHARKSYDLMRQTYTRIFDRMGFDYRVVSADSGQMGGTASAEFQILVQSGEDVLAACTRCDYAANLEVAEARPPAQPDAVAEGAPALERVATPAAKTIEQVSSLLGRPRESFLKSLVYTAGNDLVMAVVRGDHEVNETKLARQLGASEIALADAPAVERVTGAPVGFAGPVGFSGRIVVDPDAASVADAVAGANAVDEHLLHVRYGRDYRGDIRSIRDVVEGDACPQCGERLALYRGIEGGHVFLLGTRYSVQMSAQYLSEQGEKRPIVMGCYGIGLSRLIAAAVEQHHDEHGIRWPMNLAPYPVHVVQLGGSSEVGEATRRVEQELERRGIESLIDDRDERPGVKFKDADLIGIPLRVTIGERSLARGGAELKLRSETDPKNAELVPLDRIADRCSERIESLSR